MADMSATAGCSSGAAQWLLVPKAGQSISSLNWWTALSASCLRRGVNDHQRLCRCPATYRGFAYTAIGTGGTPIAMPITLAFWSFHQRPGIYSGTVRNLAGTRSYAFTYTQAIAAVAQYNTITIPRSCVDGAWPVNNTSSMVVTFAMASGSASTAPSAGAWLNGNYLAAPRPDQRRRRD